MNFSIRLLLQLLAICAAAVQAVAPRGSVPLVVHNDADSAIELFWQSPTDASLASMGPPLKPTESFGLDSYAGHKFVVQFSPHVEGSQVSFVKGETTEDCKVTYDKAKRLLQSEIFTTLEDVKPVKLKGGPRKKKEVCLCVYVCVVCVCVCMYVFTTLEDVHVPKLKGGPRKKKEVCLCVYVCVCVIGMCMCVCL
jgi:hypothetical protein